MKYLNILKYMAPGLIAGLVTAIYFSTGNSDFITIALFCTLITYAIVTSKEISSLKEKLEEKLSTMEFDLKQEASDEKIETLDSKITYVAQAASSEIDDLSSNIGSEIHEIVLMIADRKFGPEEGDDV